MATDDEASGTPDTMAVGKRPSRKGKEKVPIETGETTATAISTGVMTDPGRPEQCGTSARETEYQAGPTLPSSPGIMRGMWPPHANSESFTRANGIENSLEDHPPSFGQEVQAMTTSPSTLHSSRDEIASSQVDNQQRERALQDDAALISNDPRLSIAALTNTPVGRFLMPRPAHFRNSLRETAVGQSMFEGNPPVHERNPDDTHPLPHQVPGPLPRPGLSTEAQYARHPSLPVPYYREREPEERSATWGLWNRIQGTLRDPTWPHTENRLNPHIPEVLEVEQHLGPNDPMRAHDRHYAHRLRHEASLYGLAQHSHQRNTSGIRAEPIFRGRDPFQPRLGSVFHGENIIEGRHYGFGTITAEIQDGPPQARPMVSEEPIDFDGSVVPDGQAAGDAEERRREQMPLVRNQRGIHDDHPDFQSARYRRHPLQDEQTGSSEQPDHRRPGSPSHRNGHPHLPRFQAQGREEDYFDRGRSQQREQRQTPGLEPMRRSAAQAYEDHPHQGYSATRNHQQAEQAEDFTTGYLSGERARLLQQPDQRPLPSPRDVSMARVPSQRSEDSGYVGSGGLGRPVPLSFQSPGAPILAPGTSEPPVDPRGPGAENQSGQNDPGTNDPRIFMALTPPCPHSVFNDPDFGQVPDGNQLLGFLEVADDRPAYASAAPSPEAQAREVEDSTGIQCDSCGQSLVAYAATGIHRCRYCRRGDALVAETQAVDAWARDNDLMSTTPSPRADQREDTPTLVSDDSPERNGERYSQPLTPNGDYGSEHDTEDDKDPSAPAVPPENDPEIFAAAEILMQLHDDDSILTPLRRSGLFTHEESMQYDFYRRDVNAELVHPTSGADQYPDGNDTELDPDLEPNEEASSAQDLDYVPKGNGKRKAAKQATSGKQKKKKKKSPKRKKQCADDKLKGPKKDNEPDNEKKPGRRDGPPSCGHTLKTFINSTPKKA